MREIGLLVRIFTLVACFTSHVFARNHHRYTREQQLGKYRHVSRNLQTTLLPAEAAIKHDYCDRNRAVKNGTLAVADGLNDLVVSVIVNLETDPFYFDVSNTTFEPIGGLMYDINNIIAQRGGFTFNYTVVPFNESVDVEDEIIYYSNHSDLVAQKWYTDTAFRRAYGTGFTQPLVDASLTLVTTIASSTKVVDYFAFMEPFTNGAWICAGCLIFFHSFVLWGYDGNFRADRNRNINKEQCSAFTSLYYTFASFTTMDAVQPKTKETGFLTMGFLFFVLIFTNAYVANLASFLSAPTQSTLKVDSIQAANAAGSKTCVIFGSSSFDYLTYSQRYPNLRLIVDPDINTTPKLLASLRAGNCDCALVAEVDWETHSVDQNVNPNCDLWAAEYQVASFGGAYAFEHDFDQLCTSFIETVISYHIVQMKADGTLLNTYNANVANHDTAHCGTPSLTTAGATQLSTADMAGVFIMYIAFLGLGVLTHLFHMFKVWYKKKTGRKLFSDLEQFYKFKLFKKVSGSADGDASVCPTMESARELIPEEDDNDSLPERLTPREEWGNYDLETAYSKSGNSSNIEKGLTPKPVPALLPVNSGAPLDSPLADQQQGSGEPKDVSHQQDDSMPSSPEFHAFGQFAGDMALPPADDANEEES